MAKYIDAEVLKAKLKGKIINPQTAFINNVLIGLIDGAPAADVAEVKHGEWKPYQTPIQTRQSGWICTNCSGVVNDLSNGNTNFCPNCGANMEDRVPLIRPEGKKIEFGRFDPKSVKEV